MLPIESIEFGGQAILAYDVFTSADMTDLAKMIGDVMKPAAYGHVFFASLQSAIWYKHLVY